MDVIFTYEDGSQALSHYGVKGMKWGVRKDSIKKGFEPDPRRLKVLKNNVLKAKKNHKAFNTKTSSRKVKRAQKAYNFEKSGKASQLRYALHMFNAGRATFNAGQHAVKIIGTGIAALSNPAMAGLFVAGAALDLGYAAMELSSAHKYVKEARLERK